ncbi:MAG: spermidine synthase, partial [Gammaproteobacteria bacterium]
KAAYPVMSDSPDNFKIETRYNSIRAEYRNGSLALRSHDNALQSVIDQNQPARLALKNLEFLVAITLFLPRPQNILLLGTAAGSLLHFLRKSQPDANITAIDIDLEMVELLLAKEILPTADQRLNYVFDDASHYIEHCQQSFDLILVDIFNGCQSPQWLLQKATSDRLYSLLSNQGAVAFNLLIDSDHGFNQFYRDLRLSFKQQTLCLPVEGFENTIVYAFRYAVPECEMSIYMQSALELSEGDQVDYLAALAAIYTTNPAGSGVI